MAKKPKPPEHENLERWLVSYADFITLLFATFVVLYALSQTDVAELSKIDESLQRAFSKVSILQGNDGVMDGGQSIMDAGGGSAFIQELMAEYISPKYESQSFEQIENSIEEMKKSGELEGVDAQVIDQGLLITFDDQYLFASGSVDLSPAAKKLLDKVGVLIYEKFVMHCIRVEGHTDRTPIASAKFPSNWELSSARACTIVRYLISRFKFNPSLFSAVGYADTRPAGAGKVQRDASKDRRVEILVLKNKFSSIEKPQNNVLKMSKEQQLKLQTERKELVSSIKSSNNISPAAQALLKGNNSQKRRVIDMRNYAESKGITLDNKELYNRVGVPKYDMRDKSVEKQLENNEEY